MVVGVTEITGEVRAAADTFVGEVLLLTTRLLCFLFMDPFGEDPLLDFSDPLLDFSDPLLDFSDPLLDFSVMLTGEVLLRVGVTEVTGVAFVGEVLLFTTAVLLFLDPFGLIPGIFVGDLGFLAGLKKESIFFSRIRFLNIRQIAEFRTLKRHFNKFLAFVFLVEVFLV